MTDDRNIREVVFDDETAGHKISHGHRASGKTYVAAVPPPKPLKKASEKSPDAKKSD